VLSVFRRVEGSALFLPSVLTYLSIIESLRENTCAIIPFGTFKTLIGVNTWNEQQMTFLDSPAQREAEKQRLEIVTRANVDQSESERGRLVESERSVRMKAEEKSSSYCLNVTFWWEFWAGRDNSSSDFRY
jgi:hypothetical protein